MAQQPTWREHMRCIRFGRDPNLAPLCFVRTKRLLERTGRVSFQAPGDCLDKRSKASTTVLGDLLNRYISIEDRFVVLLEAKPMQIVLPPSPRGTTVWS